MQPLGDLYARLNRLRAESARLIAVLAETCAAAGNSVALTAEACSRHQRWRIEAVARSQADIRDSRALIDRIAPLAADGQYRSSPENRFQVLGVDNKGNIALRCDSKTEQAARMAIRFLEKTHPELQFRFEPIAGEEQ